jgi:hypothetical protein
MANKKSHLYPALIALATLPVYSMHAAASDDVKDEALISKLGDEVLGGAQRVRNLIGKFGWTTQQVCVRTLPNPPGVQQIDPNPPNQLNVPAEIVSMAGVGTATFNRDGTMHIDAGSTANELRQSQTAPGDTPMTNGLSPVCDGTYSIDPTNRAKVDWNCHITTPTPGLVIAAGPVNWDGWVADDGRTIDLNLKGTLQTLTFQMNGTPVSAVQRLCIQRFVFHKLPK